MAVWFGIVSQGGIARVSISLNNDCGSPFFRWGGDHFLTLEDVSVCVRLLVYWYGFVVGRGYRGYEQKYFF